MPKPKNKKELAEAASKNFNELLAFVDSLSPTLVESDFSTNTMNRNVRDILAHIHHWHLLMINWYNTGMSGKKPAMPMEGFTWKMLPSLNRTIWEQYQGVPLSEIRTLLADSHKSVRAIIEKHSNEDLFTKKKYHWTGSTSLGAYLISNTSSHYAWALKQIKKGIKK